MPAAFRRDRRALTAVIACYALTAPLPAATPEAPLHELETAVAEADAVWPLRDYLEFPRFDNVVISPDGKHLATGWGEDNYQRRLTILDFPTFKPARSSVLQMHYGITDLRWLDNRHLLIQPDWPLRGLRRLRASIGAMLVTDIDGRTLHSFNPVPVGTLDAPARLRVIEKRGARSSGRGPNAFGPVRAVETGDRSNGQLMFQTLWTSPTANARGYGIFQLDLHSRKQTRVAMLPLRSGKVVTGPGNHPALVVGANAVDEQLVYYLPQDARAAANGWQLAARSPSGERGLSPLAWTGQGEQYYALDGRTTPTRAVVVWNPLDDTTHLLYQHPEADMDEVWLDPSGKPWMFSGICDSPVYWYPDPNHPLARLHQALTRRLENEYIEVTSATTDLSTAVVRVSAGNRPTTFLVVDVATANSLTGMESFPKLRGRRLAPVDAVRFHARDGLTISGYLTTPLDKEGRRRRGLPLLLISHAGPGGEAVDHRYDVERQLFAARGYAVLQVSVRGTGGRGVAFERAGNGRWGREVQEDFVDAARWAMADGVAATGRTCFYGSGYGAYSAMLAAAREPELFQCVVGLGGIYDLPLMADTMRAREAGRDSDGAALSVMQVTDAIRQAPGSRTDPKPLVQLRSRNLGDELSQAIAALNAANDETVKDESASIAAIDNAQMPAMLLRAFGGTVAELQARSAINQAAAVKAKVLLIRQHLDDQVPPNQVDAMAKALRVAGNRPTTVIIGAETGGYMEPAGRTVAYKRIVDFLDDQIGN